MTYGIPPLPSAAEGLPSESSGRAACSGPPIRVVLCGTFRRDPDGLRAALEAFEVHACDVLSPADVEFVDVDRGFVFAEHERHETPREIEARHLGAMQRADFVWLHAPQGYVGPSAALELGFARALGLPVYASEVPADPVFEDLVRVVGESSGAITDFVVSRPDAPSEGLKALQEYYERAAMRRGWDNESPAECLLLLTEEVGELARALRKRGVSERDDDNGVEDVALELADVQLYVAHLANVLGLDLGQSVASKERIKRAAFRAPDARPGGVGAKALEPFRAHRSPQRAQ